jgi:hypothetical protein
VVANRAAEHRIARFKRVEEGALRDRALEFEANLAVDAGERSKMQRQRDADH